MKKTITRPDGTKEELEGTAEELAELERKSNDGKPLNERETSNRRILNEEDVKRLVAEELAKRPATIHLCGCGCHHYGPTWIWRDPYNVNPTIVPLTVTTDKTLPLPGSDFTITFDDSRRNTVGLFAEISDDSFISNGLSLKADGSGQA